MPRTGLEFSPGPTSAATASKWYGVVPDASKYTPSIVVMRPFVQYGTSMSASGVPYLSSDGPPSHSDRPGGSLPQLVHQRAVLGVLLADRDGLLELAQRGLTRLGRQRANDLSLVGAGRVNVPSISSSTFSYPE